jgi:hypothetical protein
MALIDDLINDIPAVFPTLCHVETIARAAGAQHHLLIKADAWRHSKVKVVAVRIRKMVAVRRLSETPLRACNERIFSPAAKGYRSSSALLRMTREIRQ